MFTFEQIYLHDSFITPPGGAAVMTNLVEGLSVELATGLVAAVIGTYTFIGGLGATFYVAYLNTAIIFIITIVFLMKVFFDEFDETNPLGECNSILYYCVCVLYCMMRPYTKADMAAIVYAFLE